MFIINKFTDDDVLLVSMTWESPRGPTNDWSVMFDCGMSRKTIRDQEGEMRGPSLLMDQHLTREVLSLSPHHLVCSTMRRNWTTSDFLDGKTWNFMEVRFLPLRSSVTARSSNLEDPDLMLIACESFHLCAVVQNTRFEIKSTTMYF